MRQFYTLITTVLVMTVMLHNALAQPQPVPPTPPVSPLTSEELEERKQRWQKALSAIAQKENASIFFYLGPRVRGKTPNILHTRPRGTQTMKALARATHLTWAQIHGIQTFAQFQEPNAPDHNTDLEGLIAWLTNLDPAKRQLLVEGKLWLGYVDPETRDRLLRLMGRPDMHFVTLNQSDAVLLHLKFEPRLEYIAPQTGQPYQYPLREPTFMVNSLNQKVPLNKPDALPMEPLDKAETGPLDFGEGMILPLADIRKQASAAFGRQYQSKATLDEPAFFISGVFTQNAFEAALKVVTTFARPEQEPPIKKDTPAIRALFNSLLASEFKRLQEQDVDITWMRSGLPIYHSTERKQLDEDYGPIESLPIKDFLANKTLTVDALSKGKPGLGFRLTGSSRLCSDTPVTMRPGLSLTLAAEGSHEATYLILRSGGKVKPFIVPNRVNIRLF